MAAKIVFVLILSLLLRASLSLPISLDVKTVQSTDTELNRQSGPKSRLTESKPVISSETILRIKEDNKLVQSLSAVTLLKPFEADHGKRIKRHTIKTKALCPKDRIEYGGQCLTKEKYEDYNDGSEGSDDYEAER